MLKFHLNDIEKNYPDSDAGQLLIIPTIRRCDEFVDKNKEETVFTLLQIDKKGVDETEKDDKMQMDISWKGIKKPPPKTSLEETEITGHAAVGIAHLVFPGVIKNKIIRTTEFGIRADYWIGDKESLLEVSGIYKGKLPDPSLTDMIPETRSSAAYETIMEKYDSQEKKHWDLLSMAAECRDGNAMPEFHSRFLKEKVFEEQCAFVAQLLDEKYQESFDHILEWVENVAPPEGLNIRLFISILLWFDIAFENNNVYLKRLSKLKTGMKEKNRLSLSKLKYQDGWEKLLSTYEWL